MSETLETRLEQAIEFLDTVGRSLWAADVREALATLRQREQEVSHLDSCIGELMQAASARTSERDQARECVSLLEAKIEAAERERDEARHLANSEYERGVQVGIEVGQRAAEPTVAALTGQREQARDDSVELRAALKALVQLEATVAALTAERDEARREIIRLRWRVADALRAPERSQEP